MSRSRFLIASVAGLIIVITVIVLYPFSPTDSDMAYIVKDSLKVAIVDHRISDIGMITYRSSEIILSTEHLRPDWAPESIGDYRIVLMSPDEIQSEANRSGVYVWHLFYSGFSSFGGNFVTLTLEFYPAVPPGGRGVLAGGSITMSDSRFPVRSWTGEVTGWTIS